MPTHAQSAYEPAKEKRIRKPEYLSCLIIFYLITTADTKNTKSPHLWIEWKTSRNLEQSPSKVLARHRWQPIDPTALINHKKERPHTHQI